MCACAYTGLFTVMFMFIVIVVIKDLTMAYTWCDTGVVLPTANETILL